MSPSASVTMLTPAKVRRLKSPAVSSLVPAEAVERFGKHDVEPAIQRVAHQRLETRAEQGGAGDRVIGELLDDRPALAGRKLAADAELVRDRGVPLIVGGVPRVDRNLH